MKYTIILFFLSFLWSNSQELPQDALSIIDTTGLTYSEDLYFYDLTIEESENKNIVILDWKKHRNVKAVIIELRDLKTKQLFNREKYSSAPAQLPAAAIYTIYPVSYNQKGSAITTTVARFKANKSRPLYSRSYKKVLEKKEQQRKQNAERKKLSEDGVFTFIDTTTFKFTEKLYFYNLILKESENKNKILLSWEKQRNIKFLMIELRDLKTKKLFYRDKHYINNVEFPADAEYTVFPVYYKQKGESITTTLEDFKANNSTPLSPQSYQKALEKEEKIEERKKRREENKIQRKVLREEAANERANRITPKVVILVLVVLAISIVIVFIIFLFRYATKDKQPNRNENRRKDAGW